MIDAKRLAEIRADNNELDETVVSYAELLQLVECYEAARAWALDERKGGELLALFPEATNG